MPLKINLKKAERRVVPEGDYPARVDVVEYRPKGKFGTGEPTLHLEVVTENTGNPDHDGVRIYRDQSMQEQSWWSVKELLEAALGEIEGDSEADFEFEPTDLIDAEVGISVSLDDQYDGRPRNKVDRFFPLSELGEVAEGEGMVEGEGDGEPE